MSLDSIIIRGAREHNLKNIDLELPRNRLIVITGLSGSGKSSLAFDTLYAEGQRRYVESLSAYARQFLEQLQKPDVESIEGLSPAIAIEQRNASANPRSTVATTTELYDYLRLLFARIGVPHCFQCGRLIQRQTSQQMIHWVNSWPAGSALTILAPLIQGRKGEYRELFEQVRKDGFARVRVDGNICEVSKPPVLDKKRIHSIEVVIDRLDLKPGNKERISDSIETALKVGNGVVIVNDQVFSEKYACLSCGISLGEVSPRLFSFNSPYGACPQCNGLGNCMEMDTEHVVSVSPCSACGGTRLKPEALAIKIGGKPIHALTALPIGAAAKFFETLSLNEYQQKIAHQILKEIRQRIKFLMDVGLDYLTLDRVTATLSGGEAQRIRLATQIGAGLVGVLYILDEPSIGLHQKDNAKLLATLKALRDLGNTLVVVEHDEATIRSADFIVDLGPGAGKHGGEIIASGSIEAILSAKNSLTGKYLRGEFSVPIPAKRRPLRKNRFLMVKKAAEHNLKEIDVKIPLGLFVCVTGVSGSGKSTLVHEILYRALARELYQSKEKPGRHQKILGLELLDKVIVIDQSPIGRTPRSNPATYTGTFSPIRDLFCQLPESKIRGYRPGRFSFNVKGGRCEACQGDGIKKIEMHFLPDVYVPCEICKGKRFNEQTLHVLYKGKTIADVLSMTVEDALDLFKNIPHIKGKLEILSRVGLGYLELGQSATTLSGGEAQRIKLASELSKRATGKTVYILDEPTTGLHFADIEKLLGVLHELVGGGNTVLVIEHNLDVIKTADYVIDLGPEGGDRGGTIVAEGTPEEIAANPSSYTGQYLMAVLKKSTVHGQQTTVKD